VVVTAFLFFSYSKLCLEVFGTHVYFAPVYANSERMSLDLCFVLSTLFSPFPLLAIWGVCFLDGVYLRFVRLVFAPHLTCLLSTPRGVCL